MAKKPTSQEQLDSLDKQINDLIKKRDTLYNKVNSVSKQRRDNNKLKKELLLEAQQKFVGLWNTYGDGLYHHIAKVLKIQDRDVRSMDKSKITFEVESDECIITDDIMSSYDSGLKQRLNIQLFDEDNYNNLSTEDMLQLYGKNMSALIKYYLAACKAHGTKSIKIKMDK